MALERAKKAGVRTGILVIVASLLVLLSARSLGLTYTQATFRLYCFVGAGYLAILLYLPIRRLVTGVSGGCDTLQDEIAIRMEEIGVFQKIRNYLGEFLHAGSQALLWPVAFQDYFNPTADSAQKPGSEEIEGWEHYVRGSSLESRYWLYALCLSVVVPLAYPVLGASLLYVQWFLYLLIAFAILRLLHYLFFHTSLTTIFRRLPKNPLWKFMKLVMVAYTTMVVCLTFALQSGDISLTSPSSLLTTAWELIFRPPLSLVTTIRQFILVTPRGLAGIVQLWRSTAINSAVLLCGWLTYGIFVRTIFRHKDFVRQDDDKKILARDCLMHGDSAMALRWLKTVNVVDPELLFLSTATYLGLGEEATARQYAQQLANLNAIRPTSLMVAIDPITSAFLEFPIPKSLITQRLRAMVAANERDASLYLITSSLVARGRIPPEEVLYTLAVAADRYPLTRAANLRELGFVREALDLLKSRSFTNALREICRRTLILQMETRQPHLSKRALDLITHAWVDIYFGALVEMSARLKTPRELSLGFEVLADLADFLARRRSPVLNQIDSVLNLIADRLVDLVGTEYYRVNLEARRRVCR